MTDYRTKPPQRMEMVEEFEAEGIEKTEKILWCVERMLDGTYKTAEHKKLDILNYLKRTLTTLHQELQKAQETWFKKGYEDAESVHKDELQKAREEERERQREGQVKDIKDQVRRKREHGKAMYEKGLLKVLGFIERRFEDKEMADIIRKELDQSELDQPTI